MDTRHAQFIEYYLGQANWNATEAARLCGYADPKNQGYRILKRPEVHQALERRVSHEAMSSAELLQRLAWIARGSLAPFLYADDQGEGGGQPDDGDPYHDDETPAENITLRLHTKIARANIHLLKKLKVKKRITHAADTTTEHVTIDIELHSPLEAMEKIGRALGIFKDQAEGLLKYIDLSRLSVAQLARLAAGDDLLQVLLSGNDQAPAPLEPPAPDVPRYDDP